MCTGYDYCELTLPNLPVVCWFPRRSSETGPLSRVAGSPPRPLGRVLSRVKKPQVSPCIWVIGFEVNVEPAVAGIFTSTCRACW